MLGLPYGVRALWEPVRHVHVFRDEGRVLQTVVWRTRDWRGWFA